MFGQPTPTVLALGALGAVSGIHLWAQWTGVDAVSDPTQPVLMALLALALWTATSAPRSRLVRLTLVALAFSWLGDTAPRFVDGDAAFLLMVGFFALAQVAYVVAFRPYADQSVLAINRIALTPYAVAVVLLVAICAPGAGGMLVPVLVYGALLGTMAVLATGLGRLIWVGGALFLVSDGLIAIDAFAENVTIGHSSFWVMLTYIVAQVLIVLGVLERAGDPSS
ncbi:putative membrane protein YhhN [Nocardioides daedukensis]|uniref:Putative membrane protein YhhN n=1 Tax=Nocardioides daedukensis TaxID=634462 RepID=A0A7Y9S616_9ACTN|nr:lysoplasmalogenase [Nocardioides daedukensis]NYG60414.1 putative membrane protein YhhN [Nocardioides daedukensis]